MVSDCTIIIYYCKLLYFVDQELVETDGSPVYDQGDDGIQVFEYNQRNVGIFGFKHHH